MWPPAWASRPLGRRQRLHQRAVHHASLSNMGGHFFTATAASAGAGVEAGSRKAMPRSGKGSGGALPPGASCRTKGGGGAFGRGAAARTRAACAASPAPAQPSLSKVRGGRRRGRCLHSHRRGGLRHVRGLLLPPEL